MRTLKVLSLVLALVLCFGLVGTAFAANTDKFTDAAQIGDEYAEAVEVLIGLGIVDGKTDTTVDPTGNYTREAAAKIIAYMLLGKTLADALPKESSVFTDVANGRWSAGYIAYCFEKGIIDGATETTFNPQGTLTGYAWAKMVLGALGYNKNGEYNDPKTWKMNVVTDALKYKIFDGDLAALVDAPIQRQQAMLVAFNGLNKGEAVTSKTNVTYFITDKGVYTSSADLQKAVNSGEKYIDNYTAEATNTVIANSLGQTVYGLSKVDSTDPNGRPTTEYQVGGKAIATIGAEADKVYTAAVTGGTLYADLGLKKAPDFIKAIEDKKDVSGTGVYVVGNIAEKGATKFGGNGTEISAYKSVDAAGKVTVELVVVNTYVGTVTAVDATKGTVEVTFTAKPAAKAYTIKATGFAKDDVALATYDAGKDALIAIEKVAATAMKPTSFTGATFTSGGKTYLYGANSDSTYTDSTNYSEWNFYLDKNGYIMRAKAITSGGAPTEYAIFVQGGSTTDAYSNTSNVAKIIKMDGTQVEVPTPSKYTYAKGTIVTVAPDTTPGLTKLTNVGAPAGGTTALNAKSVKVDATYNANEKTVFFVKTVDLKGVATYTTYTGLSKIPAIKSCTDYAVYDKNSDGFAEFVYVDTAVLDVPDVQASTIAFVSGTKYTTTYDAVKGTYYTYNAVVDGKITTVNAKTTTVFTKNQFFVAFTTDENGLITAATAMKTDGSAKLNAVSASAKYTKPASGVITLDKALVVNDSTLYFKVNGTTGAITATTIAADAASAVTIDYYTNDGVLAMLVIPA